VERLVRANIVTSAASKRGDWGSNFYNFIGEGKDARLLHLAAKREAPPVSPKEWGIMDLGLYSHPEGRGDILIFWSKETKGRERRAIQAEVLRHREGRYNIKGASNRREKKKD